MNPMKTCLSLALMFFVSLPALADGREIGETVLRHGEESDTFQAWNAERIQSVKVCVRGDDFFLKRLDVQFGDGSHESFQFQRRIDQGECSGWKNFATGRRNVVKLKVVGERMRSRGPIEIRVMGSGDSQGNEDGERIGVLQLGGRSDRDRASMNGDNISQVKICVKQNDARIEDFEVQFGNGQKQEINVRNFFREGSCSQWKDLAGGRRNVKEAFVRGNALGGREAKVVVFGR